MDTQFETRRLRQEIADLRYEVTRLRYDLDCLRQTIHFGGGQQHVQMSQQPQNTTKDKYGFLEQQATKVIQRAWRDYKVKHA